jgi:succinate-semialdehyde dehydrogenase/glutarate-semialdehyde dehydrogenase
MPSSFSDTACRAIEKDLTMYERFGLFIDGNWKPSRSGAVINVLDPATEEVIGATPLANADDLDEALAAVGRVAPQWRATSGWERSRLLRGIASELHALFDEIALAISTETGKPMVEAVGELRAAIEQFDWYADEARRIFGHTLDGRETDVKIHIRYDPVGPVAAFTAWNFPALLPARKIAAALAAGCPIIVKPSEETPCGTFFLAEAARRAGIPAGVLNVMTGDPAAISAHLIASPVIRKVSLTGSVPVGKLLLRQSADSMKKVSMELGGHAPVLVFDDVDAKAVGELCARTKFRNAGQVCISPTRFYVHQAVYAPFAKAMAETAARIRLGGGRDPGSECGPLINARGRERIIRLVDDAVERGATVLAGGGIPVEHDRGFFYAPTVLGGVADDAEIMREEPFGPVAPITTFTDFDDVVRRANDTSFGLAGYVFSTSLRTATRAAEALEVGMVGVNDLLLAAAEAPIGGIKQSGMGREGGQLGILDYLEPKYMKIRV